MKNENCTFRLLFVMKMTLYIVLAAICDKNADLCVLIAICDESEAFHVLTAICDETEGFYRFDCYLQ